MLIVLILLGVGSFISWYGLIETGSLTAFIFLWAFFFYFAVSNWHPGKTLGKYAVGLKVVTLHNQHVGLLRSIGRTFVGLLLPIFVADWLFQQIPAAPSKYEWIGLNALIGAVLFVIPVSIAVGKGTTGCHDLLFGCRVLSAQVGTDASNLTRYVGLTALISLLLGAVTVLALYGIGFGQMFVKARDRQASLPPVFTIVSAIRDPCDTFSLHIADGLNNVRRYILETSCYVYPNDLQIDREPFAIDSSLSKELNEQKDMLVFEVSLSPILGQRTLTKELVLRNFATGAGELFTEIDRPIFLALRFKTEIKYGLFSLIDSETIPLMITAPQGNEVSRAFFLPSQRGRETTLTFLDLRNIRQIMLGNLRPQDWRR